MSPDIAERTSAAERPVTPRAESAGSSLPPRRRYRRRAARSDLLVALCWASAAASVALFLSVGGAADFGSVASATTSLGIIAGLVGTDLVLVMLVLAARIPLVDRTIGHDRAISLHRSLGKPAFYLLLGHGALLLIGYGMAEGIDPIAEIGSLWSVPDMPLAFLAIGLFTVVVASSLVAVRRAFPYEVWHVIHLLSYAAVLTALPHQLSVGMLATSPAQRAYWIGLYVVALGSILVFRLLTPIVRSTRHGMRVAAVEAIAPAVFSIHLEGRDLDRLASAGGQFFVWRFWSASTWWHAHPISLSAVPTSGSARVTVRALGRGSSGLARLRVGTFVSFEGPYGLFTDAARTSRRLAVVAAGIGITPARALLEGSRLRPGEATVLLRASTPAELYLIDEIAALGRSRGITVYTSVGARPAGVDAWMSESDYRRGVTLASVFPHLSDSDLYLCGPLPWLDAVEADARGLGMPDHQIHSERFDL